MSRWHATQASWRGRSLAALVAAVAVGFCPTIGASLAHADDPCVGSDFSAPRFCAHSGMVDHALVVVAPGLPVTAMPEPAVWLSVGDAQPFGTWHHPAASPPRAPPAGS